ncbi:MAG: hypothetical protein ACXABD_00470 [Candidatus Thorarchaeota archaeon]|jgi:hypothetical protein
MSFRFIDISKPLEIGDTSDTESINVIYQFFIPNDRTRYKEIKECLMHNANNPHVDRVILFNERNYSSQELGIRDMSKVEQINIKKRLTFAETFRQIRARGISGYNIIINSDIFLDNTVSKLRFSNISKDKVMLAQLRHNYVSGTSFKSAKIFGPRFDSQDAWIMHSNFNPTEEECKLFGFYFGTPGCDNKLVYLFKILGYEVINDPLAIKIYHLHEDMSRNYQHKPLPPPWGLITAANIDITNHISTLGIDVRMAYNHTNGYRSFQFNGDNILFGKYILNKLNKKQNFIIPRIAGIENNYAIIGLNSKDRPLQGYERQYIAQTSGNMKRNAGIKLSSINDVKLYSDLYFNAFRNCDLYTGWEPWGDVYKCITDSHNEVRKIFPDKKILWGFVFDIFHYIKAIPWTFTLRGKRILIISSFADSMREKDKIREKIYGVDLFPECKLLYIKPPQTQADEPSEGFNTELNKFRKRLDSISGNYDVALVAAGGYGNLICDHIYNTGHSAIYVGGVLQMYFGIVGQRWIRERSDVIRHYINEHWSRPTDDEKPKNYSVIERSCYW